MSDIIDKLTEIETVASRIMDSVPVKKQEEAVRLQEEKARFDAALMAERGRVMEQFNRELELHRDQERTAVEKKSEQWMDQLDGFCQDHAEELAEEIFQKIIRM